MESLPNSLTLGFQEFWQGGRLAIAKSEGEKNRKVPAFYNACYDKGCIAKGNVALWAWATPDALPGNQWAAAPTGAWMAQKTFSQGTSRAYRA